MDMEVFVTAAELEEVEGGVAVSLRGRAGGEGAVGLGEGLWAQAVRDVDAGMGVFDGKAEEERGAEFEAVTGSGQAEEGCRRVIEDEE